MSVSIAEMEEEWAALRARNEQENPPRHCFLSHPECRLCDGCERRIRAEFADKEPSDEEKE